MNTLKTEDLRTITEEKTLSTDEVIDRYSKIISCLRSQKFYLITKPHGPILSKLIQTTLTNGVTPLSATIEVIASRIVVCESGQGDNKEVMTLKAAIAALRRGVDQLKSIDMSIVFEKMEIPNVPVDLDMPPTAIENVCLS